MSKNIHYPEVEKGTEVEISTYGMITGVGMDYIKIELDNGDEISINTSDHFWNLSGEGIK